LLLKASQLDNKVLPYKTINSPGGRRKEKKHKNILRGMVVENYGFFGNN
jgi:hypothetical protein